MNVAEILTIVRRAEEKADVAIHKSNGAYDHALDLHQKLGSVVSSIETVKLQINDIRANIRREAMASVPDLVEEEITKNHLLEEARTWQGIKAFFKTSAGRALSRGIEYALIAGGLYALHKLGVLQ